MSKQRKRMLILGGTGMAGHMVYHYFSEQGDYQMFNACFRTKLTEDSYIINVRDEKSVYSVLAAVQPDIVINCVGVLIRGSKVSPENAIFINGYFPHMLSRLLHEIKDDAKLIHISTDCVFSGKKGFYKDTDEKDALDVYGMSKNLGELINDKDLTVRTSIIGPELKTNGEGLFHWLFSQRMADSVNGYTKSIWGGVTTLELAKVIEFCIREQISGLYQASNNTAICKYDLVKMIATQFGMSVKVNPIDGVVADKSILNTDMEGNEYSVSSYQDMIQDLFDYMTFHKERYTQYLG